MVTVFCLILNLSNNFPSSSYSGTCLYLRSNLTYFFLMWWENSGLKDTPLLHILRKHASLPHPGRLHCLRSLRRHCGLVTSFAARTLPWSGLQITLEGPFRGKLQQRQQTTSRGVNRLNTHSGARAASSGAAPAHALTTKTRRSARLRELEATGSGAEGGWRPVPAARPAVGLRFLTWRILLARMGTAGQRGHGHCAIQQTCLFQTKPLSKATR